MKKTFKKLLAFLCAVCMLSSNFAGLGLVVFARREPVVLTQTLKASDDKTYEIKVSYEIELEEDEEPPEEPLLVVRELLEPEPEPAEETEPTEADAPAEEAEPVEEAAPAETEAEAAEGAEPAEAAPVYDGPTDADLSAPLGTGRIPRPLFPALWIRSPLICSRSWSLPPLLFSCCPSWRALTGRRSSLS